MTHEKWEEMNLLSKFQLHSSDGLVVTGDMRHLTCDIRPEKADEIRSDIRSDNADEIWLI